MNYRLKRWLRYIFCLVIVLILCWQSTSSSEKLNILVRDAIISTCSFFGFTLQTTNLYYLVRKIGHGIAFCILSIMGHLAISGDSDDFKTTVTWSSIINFGFALLAELFQAHARGRHPTLADATINLAGTAVGILIAMLIEASKSKSAAHLKTRS